MKKRIVSLLLAAAMLVMLMPAAFAAGTYSDTDGHWGKAAIDRWSAYGVIGGYNGNVFIPDGSMTRAEAARVFVNLLGLERRADVSQYTDVAANAWYCDDIAKCVAAGILTGSGVSTMNPEGYVTREELFTMFARALGIAPKAAGSKQFADGHEISSWAAGYVNALADMGVINGVGGNVLNPGSNINRASVMTVLDNAIKTYVNTDGATVGNTDGVVLVVADRVTVTGNVENLVVADSANTVTINGGTVDSVTVVGPRDRVVVTGAATVDAVTIPTTAESASVVVNTGATVGYVASEADNVTISGTGKVETAAVSGDNTTVDTDGTDLTVAPGTTGVTENSKPVSGGTTVETEPVQNPTPVTPVIPPVVHTHYYVVTKQIMAEDASTVVAYTEKTCSCGAQEIIISDEIEAVVGEFETADGYYVQLEKAVAAAEAGKEVRVCKNVELEDQLTIDKAITLVGEEGITITANNTNWSTEVGSADMVLVTAGATIENLTLDFNSQNKGLQIYQAGTVSLDNVTLKNSKGSGLNVNGSTVTATNLSTSGNAWQGVNVDNGSNGTTGSSSFTLVSGILTENFQIKSDKGNVTVEVPSGYNHYKLGEVEIWSTKNLDEIADAVSGTVTVAAAVEVDGVKALYTSLTDAIAVANGATITLAQDVSTGAAELDSAVDGKTTVIDLNEKNLTVTGNQSVTVTKSGDAAGSLTIKNGNLLLNNAISTNANIAVETGCSVILDDVTVTATGSVLYPRGDAAAVTVQNCNITTTGAYVIATNAATADNYNVVITVTGSTLSVDNSTVLVNVPCTLNIENSTIIGKFHSVIARGGDVTIKNSTLDNQIAANSWNSYQGYFGTSTWGSGNSVRLAALTMGNNSSSYQYRTNCTLTNVKFVVGEGQRTVSVHGNATEDIGAYLTYDENSEVGTIEFLGGYVSINGEVQNTTN